MILTNKIEYYEQRMRKLEDKYSTNDCMRMPIGDRNVYRDYRKKRDEAQKELDRLYEGP